MNKGFMICDFSLVRNLVHNTIDVYKRQALTRSEAVLQKSLDITEEADLALRNAMARIK